MHTFRQNRATPLLATLSLLGCANVMSAQRPTAVDSTVLKPDGG